MRLRIGRTKNIVDSSIESALLAVEIYNKPRASFRREGYITLMMIAWTKLFHAYFNHKIGSKYYHKERNGRYTLIDNERKAWEIKTCIKKFKELVPDHLSVSVEANLIFFIGLRNKIEHRHVSKSELDTLVFGECQSLLYNFENLLVRLFGEEYSINENLSYALQFSKLRTKEQQQANRNILSREVTEIRKYIDDYRTSLPDNIYNSQEYSIKLIQIPKITNTNRSDVAIEFVRWDELNDQDKENYQKVTAIIKDKVIKKEVANAGRLKAGDVLKEVNSALNTNLNHHDHMTLYYVFSIRPIPLEGKDKFDTNTDYCHYDEPHNDYVYKETWVNLIVKLFREKKVSRQELRTLYKRKIKKDIKSYLGPKVTDAVGE